MHRQTFRILFLLPTFILLVAGCGRQKASETESDSPQAAPHQPLPPKYQARYDASVPPERIRIEKAMADSVPVKLSQVASTIEYYMVGDDKYPITGVVATNEGFITLNQPKLYLYRQGVRRKRVGLKTGYSNWINGCPRIHFDKSSNRLYAYLTRINEGYAENYFAELPPLDSVLARVYYLYPDSLPNRYFLPKETAPVCYFSSDCFATYQEDEYGFDNGIGLFNLNGDTLCLFTVGIDSTIKRQYTLYQPPFFSTIYKFDNRLTFRLSFCDTIYHIMDNQRYVPAYVTNFGKSRLTAIENIRNEDRKGKAWMRDMEENAQALFFRIYQERTTTGGGWLDEKREADKPSVERQIVYLKKSKQTLALPNRSGGLINDLDGGLPFWPDGQTDGYLYMIRPAKELKARIKLTGSPKQEALKAFLAGVDEKQNVLIVVK